MSERIPNAVNLHKQSRELELSYSGSPNIYLSCEYLRVYSPSAEVRGHGEGQGVLQTGKLNVSITSIEPVGNYGLKLVFDDGHDSGIYTWAYLWELCQQKDEKWQRYLSLLEKEEASRDPNVGIVRFME